MVKTILLAGLTFVLAGCSTPQDVRPVVGYTMTVDLNAPTRTIPEIQQIFDIYKGPLNGVYNTAARQGQISGDGKIRLTFTIEPDGSVSAVKVVSSTFGSEDFDRAFATRVQQMKFRARDVPVFTCENYPITFHPQ
jgi:protein TonB